MFKTVITFLVFLNPFFCFANKADSIGTKVKDGKVFILHKVEKGDGMYKISKKYNVGLQELIAENPGSDKMIRIGQVIMVPTKAVPVLQEKVVEDFFDKDPKDIQITKDEGKGKNEVSTFAKYHTVVAGETMYAISKKYNTSVDLIMALNNLSDPALSTGQQLLVQDGLAESKTVDVNTELETLKKELDSPDYKDLGFDTAVETAQTKNPNGYTIRVEKLLEYNIEKVEETGTASIGAQNVPEDKNFAEHFDAPLGTVIMVTNPATGQSVFVKVVANFKKKEDSAHIIKLSQRSAQQIGFSGKGAVELSYAR